MSSPTLPLPRSSLPQPGERLGAYVVERLLARGGMGAVFVATQVDLDRQVALKVLLPGANAEAHARFLREARAAARLEHPNVVRVIDVGEDRGRPFLTMELIEGESLDERLHRTGPLPGPEAALLLAPVAEALDHAHGKGILHRDVKPANVLIDALGLPRLADFGLAKPVDATSLTATGLLLGTPAYMPPEQAAGEEGQVGPAADVYAVGATLYKALTGETPYGDMTALNLVSAILRSSPRPPSELVPVDPALEAIVMRCLAREPGARYASAGELARALRAFAQGDLVAPASPRLAWAAVGALGAVACAAAGYALLGLVPAGEPAPRATPRATPSATPSAVAPPLVELDAAAIQGPALPGLQLFGPFPTFSEELLFRGGSDHRTELRLPLRIREDAAFELELELVTQHLDAAASFGACLVSADPKLPVRERRWVGWVVEADEDGDGFHVEHVARARTRSQARETREAGARLPCADGSEPTRVSLRYTPDPPALEVRARRGEQVDLDARLDLGLALPRGDYLLRLGVNVSPPDVAGWVVFDRQTALLGALRVRLRGLTLRGDGLALGPSEDDDHHTRLGLAGRALCRGEPQRAADLLELQVSGQPVGAAFQRIGSLMQFYRTRALARAGDRTSARGVLSLITDTLEQTDDLPYLDRVLGAAALELTPDELALAAEHFGNRMPRRGMAFLRQARLEAEEAEQEAWERFQARGNRAKVADLVRRARTLWMQALLGLRHEGSQIAPNPERALGMCLLGVGDAEAALPMLEATEAWDYAARAAWHLGDYAKADRYYQQTTRELSPYDARCKALVAKLAQR